MRCDDIDDVKQFPGKRRDRWRDGEQGREEGKKIQGSNRGRERDPKNPQTSQGISFGEWCCSAANPPPFSSGGGGNDVSPACICSSII